MTRVKTITYTTPYTTKEEIANTITHGIGLLASMIGLYLLLTKTMHTDQWLAVGIFGLSLILCYGTSTFYHWVGDLRWKYYLKIADHAAIYLLIAGTYTPFALYVVQGSLGSTLLIVIWSLAIIGVVFKLFYVKRFKRLSTFLYLGMGWMAVIAMKSLWQNLDTWGVSMLIGGGLSYSMGVYFFLKEKMPYHHAIWHVFVLGGSLLHFLCVYCCVVG